MIEVPAFIDLHTHTRYPDKSFFPAKDIEKSALNGGYSDILAMPNSEIIIDDIEALNYAREIDSSLNLNVHRVGALSKHLSGKELVDFKSFIQNGITIFSDDGKSLIEDTLADEAFKIVAELGGAIFQHCEKSCFSNPGDIAPPSNSSELILIPDSEEFEILKRDLELVEKLASLGVPRKQIFVTGHSCGGLTTLLFFSRYPEKAGGGIAYAPACFGKISKKYKAKKIGAEAALAKFKKKNR